MRSETSFALDGDLIVIDAVVIGPAGRANIQLVLDTGAVLTTLVPTVAQAIGYSAAMSIRPLCANEDAQGARIERLDRDVDVAIAGDVGGRSAPTAAWWWPPRRPPSAAAPTA